MAHFLKIAIITLWATFTMASPLDDNNILEWHAYETPCSWTEDMSPCDMIRALQKSLIAVEGKMVEVVEQQYIIKSLTRKLELQGQEIHRLGKTLALLKGERSWELPPKTEPLVWHKDGEANEVSDESYTTAKFEDLVQQMQNLSSNFKVELGEERRLRHLLQEEVRIQLLNSTQPLASIDERLDNFNRTILAENLSERTLQNENTKSTERRLEHLEREISLLRHSLSTSEEEQEEKDELKEELKEEESDSCPPLDYEKSPGLILKVSSGVSKPGQTVYFSCSGDRILLGDAFTRCRTDGTWSHGSLPLCVLPEEE